MAPARRFTPGAEKVSLPATLPGGGETTRELSGQELTRRVRQDGKISLEGLACHVGGWLAGENVAVVLYESGLLEVSHRGVPIACSPTGTRSSPRRLSGLGRHGHARPARRRRDGRCCAWSITPAASASPAPATASATATAASRSRCA